MFLIIAIEVPLIELPIVPVAIPQCLGPPPIASALGMIVMLKPGLVIVVPTRHLFVGDPPPVE